MVTVIVLVGVLLAFSICALIWLTIKAPDRPLRGLLPDKTDRP